MFVKRENVIYVETPKRTDNKYYLYFGLRKYIYVKHKKLILERSII